MIGFVRKLAKDRRGNILVIAAATMPLMIGAAGLATDTIQWTLWKRELQRAADSAAIAGVYTRHATGSTSGIADTVIPHDLSLNQQTGIALATGYPRVTFPADAGDMRDQVAVELAVQKMLPFSSMFMSSAPLIRVNATAASVPGADTYCVIALDPSASATGIEIGGSATLDIGECSLIANAMNPNTAATNTGNASNVHAKSLAAGGGVQYSKSWSVKSYDPYSTPVKDPFANLPMPKKTDCQKTINVQKKDFPIDRSSTDTSHQVVCISGGLDVQGTAKLGPATYVIDGGDLNMNSTGSSLTCTGCTIILTNFTDPTKTGNIKLTGGTLNIVAPTDDSTYKGIALYQDRRATDTGKKTQNQINGNNGASITGVIYIPNQSVLYNGGGSLNAACMQLVGKRLEFSGNSAIKLTDLCGGAGLDPVGGGRVIRLVA